MSVEIDWSLLSEPSPTGQALAEGLMAALNQQLNTAARPSFLGPVTVSSFDFGKVGPSVEIKDIRDVWRAFDEGDEEGDAEIEARELEAAQLAADEFDEPLRSPPPPYAVHPHPTLHQPLPISPRPRRGRYPSHVVAPGRAVALSGLGSPDDDEGESVHSGIATRSVASVGLGVGSLALRRPFGSPMRVSRPPSHVYSRNDLGDDHRPATQIGTGRARQDSAAPASSPPPSPPVRPAGLENDRSSSIPPVQMHLRVEHAADLSLTLFTSLQVNYPSPLFMSLPLKLVITGLTLAADVVIAYSSRKNRVHITIVDTGDDGTMAEKHDYNAPYAYGQHQQVDPGHRILPHLHIESEIGHADAHVLRNVGKVERFIVNVVRKTLVDELVFPHFHTIALP
ncbi:uncharacterized protein CcaverHIS019_0111490 [Cutaneotrichosporon cavernicola]|uniref:Mitochondrial distribution and morphology protein 12 n=1 Tax=Cutaneotrichosporon cavernicola TaxID=279322 RepID=A0AA48KZA6_9TREE|nr:uncharacterized protein CcaverHIS019_0111490 [Cutaneotrichosporon cavernicola]BEI88431.1 hypothetical protein CcaverHIS019_0111490 [Cutaneotrichosporon cavernicola]BEI96204.1 hypothetical protein CcaverHIS631_0111530 [Cutaneotrichosporon cavernicola]BEJ03975.1 hypothetical protein CcaverHIS641_0111500 [Cutaneotrichosporon cavernicola]